MRSLTGSGRIRECWRVVEECLGWTTLTTMALRADRFEADFKMIRRKGTIVSVGNASGAVPPFPPLKLVEKNVRLLRPTYVPVFGLAPPSNQC